MGSDDSDGQRRAAEQRARVLIDGQLTAAGWSVQDKKHLNLFAAEGVACREAVMAPGHGRADYLLYVDQKVVGVVEAKPVGTTLSGVEWQSAMYADGLPTEVRLRALTVDGRLPFVFEASGSETHFTNGYDPDPRARRIFNFPKPAALTAASRRRGRPGSADVLLNEGGDRDKLGRGWVWEGQIDGCIHQNHVFRARLRDDSINPYFLSWTTNTIGAKWAERNGKQSVNLASISLSMIRKMPVIVPPPGVSGVVVESLHESLAVVDRLDTQLAAVVHRGAALRRALLAAAFAGNLTGSANDLDRIDELAQ